MNWVYDDGGRIEAEYKGFVGDCVVISISIVTGKPYKEIYSSINLLSKDERIGKHKSTKSSSRNGVYKFTYARYMKSIGYKWVPTMSIGSGCTVHLKKDELPEGNLLVKLSKHITAVIDGVIHDLENPSREETRCVYGYFIKEN